VKIDARLPNGSRADALLVDSRDNVELVIQLDGSGSRLANRIDAQAGLPMIVLRSAMLVGEPERWWTSREHGLPAWRCRCTGTRALHVDDDFSLRVIDCPIRLRSDGGTPYARVIEDCGRCAFFVGIGYIGNDRRRIQLRCGFGAPPAEARAPLITLAPPAPRSASRNRGWIVTAPHAGLGHPPDMFDFDVLDVGRPADELAPRRRELFTLSTIRFDARVTEVPRGPALTLAPETTVATTIAALRRRARGAAVVVQNHRPVGVITERELLHAGGEAGAAPIATLMDALPGAHP
jgi:hypothetical protein